MGDSKKTFKRRVDLLVIDIYTIKLQVIWYKVVTDVFKNMYIDNFKILQTWFCLEEAFEPTLAEQM